MSSPESSGVRHMLSASRTLANLASHHPRQIPRRRSHQVFAPAHWLWLVARIDGRSSKRALMICFIVLWLGVGNVLSVLHRYATSRSRTADSPTPSMFIIALALSYLIGYLVSLTLISRVFAG